MSEWYSPGPLRRTEAVSVFVRGASEAFFRGRLEDACLLLRRALDVDPCHVTARVYLADCLIDMHRFRDAAELLEDAGALARQRSDMTSAVLCGNRLVSIHLRVARQDAARRLLQSVLQTELAALGGLSATTLLNVSLVMRGLWSVPQRLRLLEGALLIAQPPERIEVLRQQGRLLVEAGRMEAALAALDRARRLAVGNAPPSRLAPLLADQGLALVQAGRYADAGGALQHASKLYAGVGNLVWSRRLQRLVRRVWRAQQRLSAIIECN